MDRRRFDALTRILAATGSRRGALGALLGAALLGRGMDAPAKGKGKKHGNRGKNRGAKKRQAKHRKTRQQAVPARCFPGSSCTPGPSANLTACDFGGTTSLAGQNLKSANLSKANLHDADATGADFSNANLGKACLVDANLTGATFSGTNTSGAIFCRTVMPNGTVNDSGCTKGTACCPTCIEFEEACGQGIGGSCCDSLVCDGGTCQCATGEHLCPDGSCGECCEDEDCGVLGDICNGSGQCRCGSGPICTGDEVCESGQCVLKVSPANQRGWFFYNDETDVIDSSLGSYVSGPANPPLGDGSVRISVTGTQRRNLATYQFSGVPLATITQLKFRTYNPSAGNGGSANRSAYLNFNVDFNGSDTWQRRLAFVPSNNGAVIQNQWQQWDAINGGAAKWSYSGPTWPAPNAVPGTTLKTWSQILADYPGVRIRVTDSWLGMRVGEPYTDGYTENIDSFTFGAVSGTKIFDFEANP